MRRLPAAAAALALTVTACGGESADGCVEVREALDPASTLHVIDPDRVTFLTDPPTSGPHVAGPAVVGAVDRTLDPAAQVRVLESGGAVVQYGRGVDADTLLPLLDAAPGVVIAPGAGLPDDVVATAWTWKLSCGGVDLDRLEAFVVSRPAHAPGLD